MDASVYQTLANNEDQHWWFKARRNVIRSILKRTLDHSTSSASGNNSSTHSDNITGNTLINTSGNANQVRQILEIGCGTGGNLQLLAEFGEVTGIEPDTFAFEHAQTKHGNSSNNINIQNKRLPSDINEITQRFDVVVLFDVLEHIENDSQALTMIREQLLKPDGQLILTVPAYPSLWSKHDELHHHYRRYNSTIKQLLRENGFRIEWYSHFNFMLLPLVIVVRGLRKLFRSDGSDDAMPPKWLNSILYQLFNSEKHLLSFTSIPCGLSICMVCKDQASA